MSNRQMFFGAILTVAASGAFAFATPALAAPGQNNNTSGGGNGFASSSFGGGYNAGNSGGGYNAGHASGGFGGGTGTFGTGGGVVNGGGRSPFSSASGGHSNFGGNGSSGSFARPLPSAGGHSSSPTPSFQPNAGTWGTNLLPSQLGGSHGPLTTHPYGPYGGSWLQAVDQWRSGQKWSGHWNWNWNWGNTYFPSYFVFVPFYYYGSNGYYNPYYFGYSDPSAYYALYGDGDTGLPPFNVNPNVIPANPNPGPVIAAGGGGANAAANAVANNAPANNAAANNVGADLVAADVPNPNGDAGLDAGGDNSAGAEFFAQAEAAFQAGHYRDALRLANHAAVESPRNPKAHELMSLAMFASGDYRGAAIEAHVAIALGPIADWATLFGYYGDQQRYTTQLRALEKYSRDNPKAADARFLRAYHYLMTSHTDAAKEQLTEAVKLTPNDKLAAELLKKTNANPPAAVVPAPAAPIVPPQNPAVQPKAQPPGLDS